MLLLFFPLDLVLNKTRTFESPHSSNTSALTIPPSLALSPSSHSILAHPTSSHKPHHPRSHTESFPWRDFPKIPKNTTPPNQVSTEYLSNNLQQPSHLKLPPASVFGPTTSHSLVSFLEFKPSYRFLEFGEHPSERVSNNMIFRRIGYCTPSCITWQTGRDDSSR